MICDGHLGIRAVTPDTLQRAGQWVRYSRSPRACANARFSDYVLQTLHWARSKTATKTATETNERAKQRGLGFLERFSAWTGNDRGTMSSVPVVPPPTLQAQKSTWENHVDRMVKPLGTHRKQSMCPHLYID